MLSVMPGPHTPSSPVGVGRVGDCVNSSLPYRVIVSVADFVTPPYLADRVTVRVKYTLTVVTVNVALVLPAGTVTVAGVVAEEELSLSETVIPPLGAAPLNVTLPCELLPPLTLVGLRVRELNVTAAGLIVSVAVRVTPP